MDIQVLVSSMYQSDFSLIKKMNIQSDAIIINQCDKNEFEEFKYKGYNIKFLSFAERGVGLSRNNALMRATKDICLFSDEDVKYESSYKEKILKAFNENPQADIILFNVTSTNPERPTYIITKNARVRMHNSLKYGAVRIAAKTEKLRLANVHFSLLFGGGAKYSSGEDSLFIAECIRKGLKVYTNSEVIGCVEQKESTWFEGYTDKYFIDKGVFFASLSKRWSRLLCLQFALRHRNLFREVKTISEAIRLMFKGVKKIK